MSKKSILLVFVVCLLMIAAVGLTGCRSKEPVIVTPPDKEVGAAEDPSVPLIWPFTGLDSENRLEILARPLSVKIDNHPQSGSKVGINSADLVFENLTEGGITRFNAIFQSNIPDEVMPVRSAREADVLIIPQFGDALFFYSGSNSSVRRSIRDAGIATLEHGEIGSDLYRRVPDRRAPHNLAVDLSSAYEVAEARELKIKADEPIKGLAFLRDDIEDTSTPEESTDADADAQEGTIEPSSDYRGASKVSIPFSPHASTQWTWDDEAKLWMRTMGGNAQYDGASDEQISTNNLVVMWAEHTPATRDTYAIDLIGGGKVSVFTDGKQYDGVWEGSADAPPVFKDSAGNPILLTPGRTWISVVKTGEDISSSYDGPAASNESDNNGE